MAIPLWRSAFQRLFTKAFSGGSRSYATQATLPSDSISLGTSIKYAIVFCVIPSLARSAGERSVDKKAKREQQSLLDSKANGEGGQA